MTTDTNEQEQQFVREPRYLVFKRKDMLTYLTNSERTELWDTANEVYKRRAEAGKPPLQCAVVESDWPEYEPVWAAIEERVTGVSTALPLADPELDATHGPTKMLLAVEHWKAEYQGIKFEHDELRTKNEALRVALDKIAANKGNGDYDGSIARAALTKGQTP